MRFIPILFFAISGSAAAECYVVGDLKGSSIKESDGFVIDQDSLRGSKFIIEVNGKQSSVTPSDMACTQIGNNNLVCLNETSDGKFTMENWSLFPAKAVVTYTKTINGYGVFNGASMFSGTIKGKCN